MTRTALTRSTAVRRIPIIAGVVTLAVIAGLLLAMVLVRQPVTGAADPSPVPTDSPSAPASPDPTVEPSEEPVVEPSEEPSQEPVVTPVPQPTAEPLPEPVILPPGSMARVIIDALNVRLGPDLDTNLLETVLRGEILVVNGGSEFGPRYADGYTWYPVVVLGTKDVPAFDSPVFGGTHLGWAALGTDTAAFVEGVAPRCVDGNPSLTQIQDMLAWERVACFGDRSITLEGVYGCGGCGGMLPGKYEPYWLASPMYYEFLSTDPSKFIGPTRLRFAPDNVIEVPTGSIVRVTGHFNDAASASCEIATGVEEIPVDPAVAELHCRAEFVVESVEIIGFDEDFPLS